MGVVRDLNRNSRCFLLERLTIQAPPAESRAAWEHGRGMGDGCHTGNTRATIQATRSSRKGTERRRQPTVMGGQRFMTRECPPHCTVGVEN